MRSAVGAAALIVALVGTAGADAAQRYAAPEGKGASPCVQAEPCSLGDAMKGSASNDEVIVTAGTYPLGELGVSTPLEAENVDVHGAFGGPMPKITGTENSGYLLYLGGAGDSLRYLDVADDAPVGYGYAVECGVGGLVERVRVSATGPKGVGIFQLEDCLVRDSLIRADGAEATALFSSGYAGGEGVVRNLTAIATGSGSVGVLGETTILAGAQSHTLDIKNTIASGDGSDLKATANSTYQVAARIAVSNSNFDTMDTDPEATIASGGANQSAAALYADAAGGDYREAPGSPTIDAGSTDRVGTLDLDGGARTIGPTPDIGAYELVPAAVPPVAPGQIQSLAIGPSTFRAANFGDAILSARKVRAPVGAMVEYALSAPATVEFAVERKAAGRRAGTRCVKRTRANRAKRKCALYSPVAGGFALSGVAGKNLFRFSGRLVRALGPGSYRLTGRTGASSRTAGFRIVK